MYYGAAGTMVKGSACPPLHPGCHTEAETVATGAVQEKLSVGNGTLRGRRGRLLAAYPLFLYTNTPY